MQELYSILDLGEFENFNENSEFQDVKWGLCGYILLEIIIKNNCI